MLRSVLLGLLVALCFASALGAAPLDAALQPLATAPLATPEPGADVLPQPTTPEQAAAEGAQPADLAAQAALAAEGPMILEDRLAALEELVVELSFKLDQALAAAGRAVPGSGIGDEPAPAPLPEGGAAPASAEDLQPDVGLPIVSASPSLSDLACSKQSMFVSSVESALCPPQRPYRLCTGAIGAGNAICFSEPTTPSMISGNASPAFFY